MSRQGGGGGGQADTGSLRPRLCSAVGSLRCTLCLLLALPCEAHAGLRLFARARALLVCLSPLRPPAFLPRRRRRPPPPPAAAAAARSPQPAARSPQPAARSSPGPRSMKASAWDSRARSSSAPRAGYVALSDSEERRPILQSSFRRQKSSDEFKFELGEPEGGDGGGGGERGGDGGGASATRLQVIDASQKPSIKSGRQRKKQAVRTKGGEFQARRRKRRVYFCSVGSEIDVEKMFEDVHGGVGGEWKRGLYTNVLHLYLPSQNIAADQSDQQPFACGSFDPMDQPAAPGSASYALGIDDEGPAHPDAPPLLTPRTRRSGGGGGGDGGGAAGGGSGADYTTDAESSIELLAPPHSRSPFLLSQSSPFDVSAGGPSPDVSALGGASPSLQDSSPGAGATAGAASLSPATATASATATATATASASASASAAGTTERGEFPLTAEQSAAGYKEVFVFDFGAIVFWGFSLGEEESLLAYVRSFTLAEDKLSLEEVQKSEDDMAFVVSAAADAGDQQPTIRITNDVFSLPEYTTVKERLAISFASAQSSVLAIFEARIEKKVEEFKYIPETFAREGRLRLSSKALGKMIGDVFVIRHDVNLHTEILDTPEFFWGNEAVVHLYKLTYDYLEMAGRTEILNKRLDMLKQLLSMLQQQSENNHNVKLEWIIIWLIIVSIVLEILSVGGKVLGYWD